MMNKRVALFLLGDGSVTAAARACGITVSAVSQWPDTLAGDIENRVLAAMARMAMEGGRPLPTAAELAVIEKHAAAAPAAPTPDAITEP